MTLEQHLGAGYRYEMRHEGADPARACAAEVPRGTLAIEAERLALVQQRCHISRVRLAFIRRVMALDR